MKFWNRKTGEMFNDILSARAPFCSHHVCRVCPMPNLFRADSLPKEILSCHDFCVKFPREAAAIMGCEVVEDEMQIPFVCQRLGVEPGQPFLLHGYPYKNYPPLVWIDGQIRQYSPDGNHGFKLGGRAVCWMMEHPESIEPLRGYVPEEVAFKENKISQVKEANMNKPRICEVLGVEVGEPFKVDGYGSVNFYIDENGEACSNYTNDPDYCTAIYQAINHPDRIIRKPRWTEQDMKDAKTLKRLIACACFLWRDGDGPPKLYDEDGRFISVLRDCFAALPSETKATLDEIIGGTNE